MYIANNSLIKEIKSFDSLEAEKENVAKASLVTVKKDRTCITCKKVIHAGSTAITASHMVDKRYGVTLKDLIEFNCMDEDNFKFVPVRHWMCTCCATKIVENHRNRKNKIICRRHHIRENRLGENRLEELYKKGEITAKEWDDIEMAELHQYALEEAVGIGQE